MTREHCPTCGQTLIYSIDLDKGTVDILTAIAKYINEKGINAVHPRKELEPNNILSSNQVGNLSRPRFHGLIAKIPGNAGNYCLTRKGIAFLAGEATPRITIIQKATVGAGAHTIDHGMQTATIAEFNKGWGEYWSADGYSIKGGSVITRIKPRT